MIFCRCFKVAAVGTFEYKMRKLFSRDVRIFIGGQHNEIWILPYLTKAKWNNFGLLYRISIHMCLKVNIKKRTCDKGGPRNQTTHLLVESIDFHGFRFPFNYVNYILQGSSILLNNHTYREYFCSWRYSNNCVTCAHCTLLWLLVSYWITYFPFFPWGYLMKTQNTSMITKA